eukprot:TRINITY_DN10303_c0_g1_i3.p1 TRINITY_DN10303_c0_g1~~TRINITY_DN10303_c0_g1_i3.p1  ORF type:complete len:213 (-),score=77.09 TRINITY_DN10303_c0_g1_i3:139-777(-)
MCIRDSLFTDLLADVIKPAAKWFSGRMVERKREAAVELLRRTLAAGCMCAIVDDQYMIEVVTEACEHGVDDDWNPEMRKCSTVCLGELIAAVGRGKAMDSALLLRLWPTFSKRLDDKLDPVRMATLGALEHYFNFLTDDLPQEHIEAVISLLMVHLDDPSAQIRAQVAQVLKQATEVSPRWIVKECQEARSLHQTPVHCDELLQAAQAVLAR